MVTIDEAIKLQTELDDLLPEVGFDKYRASTKLGIEALKCIKNNRQTYGTEFPPPLPGETEE